MTEPVVISATEDEPDADVEPSHAGAQDDDVEAVPDLDEPEAEEEEPEEYEDDD